MCDCVRLCAGYSDISVPGAALGKPAASQIARNNGVRTNGGRARVAVDLSVEVGRLSSEGYGRLSEHY